MLLSMCLVIVEKGLFEQRCDQVTFRMPLYHNSDGSHSPPCVIFYRFVLNKIDNNKHAEYVIFIPFKGQRCHLKKAIMFLFCLGHGSIIFPYLDEAKVSTVNSDLTNFVAVTVLMKTINNVFLTRFSYTLFTKTLLLFHISLLKRFIYRRVNTSKILHSATIPVTLTEN